MTKRGCLKISAEVFKELMNLPKDMDLSKIILNDDYTIDVYGFSSLFEDMSEGCYVAKRTLQWV